jgi:hypothetical protein
MKERDIAPMKRPLAYLLVAAVLAGTGCDWGAAPDQPPRTVSGVLVHHPLDVRSVAAWKGHQFVVDGVPVLPSPKVPEAQLRKHVGKRVVVTGRWNPGALAGPGRNDAPSQAPLGPDPDAPMTRGDGIVAETLQALDGK